MKKYKDYQEYLEDQKSATLSKRGNIWVQNDVLDYIIRYVTSMYGHTVRGICHGVRTGYEVRYLREYLDGIILGTDLVSQGPDILEWDFNEIQPEWIGSFDFIYSNALDHSYSPKPCLRSWINCLKSEGVCFIEWSINHGTVTGQSDCFTATLEEYVELVKDYCTVQVVKIKPFRDTHLLIIRPPHERAESDIA